MNRIERQSGFCMSVNPWSLLDPDRPLILYFDRHNDCLNIVLQVDALYSSPQRTLKHRGMQSAFDFGASGVRALDAHYLMQIGTDGPSTGRIVYL